MTPPQADGLLRRRIYVCYNGQLATLPDKNAPGQEQNMHLPTLSRPLAVVGAFFLVMDLLVSLKLGERTARQRSQVIDIAITTAEHGGFSPTTTLSLP